MTQGQGIVKGDAQQKLGSAGFIVGVLLWLLGSLLITGILANANSMQDELKAIGELVVSAQAGELILTLNIIAVVIGMAGVYRSVTTTGVAWVRAGFYLFLVGSVFWALGYAIDVAVASAMANWLAAPAANKEAAYSVVAALTSISRGTFPMTVLIYWLALVPLGIGMIRSFVYPRWLGWPSLMLGVAGFALGIVQTFNGRESTFNLFMILYPLTMLWFLVLGIWIARKAW
jgi:hypothetical protein